MPTPADLPDQADHFDVADQLDEEALLNGGPDAVTDDNTFGLTLDDIPF
jgi:hypothetical protein